MSIRQTSVVWKLHKIMKIKQSHLLMLLCLAEHANDEGSCFPSIKTISKETHMSISTVKRTIASIRKEHKDLLEVKPGGGRFSNYYRLTLPSSLYDEWDLEHTAYKRMSTKNVNEKVRKNYADQFTESEVQEMDEEIDLHSTIKEAVETALEKLQEFDPDTALPEGVQVEIRNGKVFYQI